MRRVLVAAAVASAVMLWMVRAWAFSPDPGVALSQKCQTMDEAVMDIAAMNKGCSDISTMVFLHICKGQMMDGKPVPDDKTLGNTKVCSHPANDPRYAVLTQAFWFLADPSPDQLTMTTRSGSVTPPGGWAYSNGDGTWSVWTKSGLSEAPIALGPYPTEAMCKEAERQVMPSNEKFWNEQDKKDAAMRAADRAARARWQQAFDDRMTQLAKENPKEGTYRLWDGTVFYVTKDYGATELHAYAPPNMRGKSIPKEPTGRMLPPPADTYTVDQECQPVSGWYRSISITGGR